jgi:mannose-1-phosphate guanylyltransferase
VGCFWEKPSLEEADVLYLKGCLWNTMVLVAPARVLLGLFESLTPMLMQCFDPIKRSLASTQEADVLREVYTELPSINFSRAILAPSSDCLGVVRVRGVYWSDWGDPTRLRQDLVRLGLRTTLA